MPPRSLAFVTTLVLAASLAFAGGAPPAEAGGGLSISIGGPNFGVTYTKAYGHSYAHAYVAPAPRVCRPVVVRPRIVHPVRSYVHAPRVVQPIVHAPVAAPVYVQGHHGKAVYTTKHKVHHGKKKTKVVSKHKVVYRR